MNRQSPAPSQNPFSRGGSRSGSALQLVAPSPNGLRGGSGSGMIGPGSSGGVRSGSRIGTGFSRQSGGQASASGISRAASARPAAVVFSGENDETDEVQQAHRELAAQRALDEIENTGDDEEPNTTLWERSQWKSKLYGVIEPGSFPSDMPESAQRLSLALALFTSIVIMVSCASICVLSFPEYYLNGGPAIWSAIEVICVVFFTADFAARAICAPSHRKFFSDPLNYIDIISIFPFYASLFGVRDVPWFVRMLRSLRLMRLVRVLNHFKIFGLKALIETLFNSLHGLVLFLILSGTAVLVYATFIYFVERGQLAGGMWVRKCDMNDVNCFVSPRNGTEASPFQSIPGALWYTIGILSTTGLGEQVALSEAGHFITGMMCFTGIMLIAVPTMVTAGHYKTTVKTEACIRNTFETIHEGRLKLLSQRRKRFTPNVAMNYMGCDTGNPNANAKKKSHVVALFSTGSRLRELRQNPSNPQDFFYEPILDFERASDGRPMGRVIWAQNAQSTLVQFNLILDTIQTRETVGRIVSQVDPMGIVRCEATNGLTVRHSSPLAVLSSQRPGKDGQIKTLPIIRWEMFPCDIRPGMREMVIPLYFRLTGEDWDNPQLHQDDRKRFTEHEVLEDCYAALLGSSFVVECNTPTEAIRRRLPVITQCFIRTRLHRELEILAHKGQDISQEGAEEELMAYITESDFIRLTAGVHCKLDLIDTFMTVEDRQATDRLIADVLLKRLRRLHVVQVPARFRQCVYNADVLEPEDWVCEVPLSMFKADETDEVEIDAVGYVNLDMHPTFARTTRIDFGVELTIPAAPS
jgi:hypothetical protein